MARSVTGRVLGPGLVAFIHGGVAVGVATRNRDLRPAYTRGWGPAVAADRLWLTLCVIAARGSPSRENLEGNGAIAVVFNPPTVGQALQLKGAVVEAREPVAGDLERAEQHLEAFAAEAERVGASPGNAQRLFVHRDFLAVTLSIDEVFDQTPGERAGVRL
jgi:hypothetical protein